jgi:hypothetical protein
MCFNSGFAGFPVFSATKNDAMNTEAEPLRELKLMTESITSRHFELKFFHGCQIKSERVLSPRQHEIADQRQFHLGGPKGTRFVLVNEAVNYPPADAKLVL